MAGELAIPFTTGVLVGIGESRSDRIVALEAIAAAHRDFGHVQEVIVQNFVPKPGTLMRNHPAVLPRRPARDDRARPPDPARRRAPAGATQPRRRPRCPDRRRHRRLRRDLAGHRRPREPGAAMAACRRAASGRRGPWAGTGPAADDLPGVRPRPGPLARRERAVRRARPLGCRGHGARRSGIDVPRAPRGRRERGHRAPRSSRSAVAPPPGTPAPIAPPMVLVPGPSHAGTAVSEVLAGVAARAGAGSRGARHPVRGARPGGRGRRGVRRRACVSR